MKNMKKKEPLPSGVRSLIFVAVTFVVFLALLGKDGLRTGLLLVFIAGVVWIQWRKKQGFDLNRPYSLKTGIKFNLIILLFIALGIAMLWVN